MAAPVMDQELVWTVTGLPAGGASAANSIAPFPNIVRGQYVELILYVRFSSTSDSGKITLETASSDDYAGTWAAVGSTIDWAANTSEKYAAVTGVFGALRARLSTACTTGSVRVFTLGSSR